MGDLSEGWIEARQRLRKCIKVALRKKPLTYIALYNVCRKVNTIASICQDVQEFSQAIFILEKLQDIGKNDDELYYVPGITPMPKQNRIRSLDDDWIS